MIAIKNEGVCYNLGNFHLLIAWVKDEFIMIFFCFSFSLFHHLLVSLTCCVAPKRFIFNSFRLKMKHSQCRHFLSNDSDALKSDHQSEWRALKAYSELKRRKNGTLLSHDVFFTRQHTRWGGIVDPLFKASLELIRISKSTLAQSINES